MSGRMGYTSRSRTPKNIEFNLHSRRGSVLRTLFELSLLSVGLRQAGQQLVSYFVSAGQSFCYLPSENGEPPFSVLKEQMNEMKQEYENYTNCKHEVNA